MGVAASAELEQAQGQVKRLTVEMQKLSTALKGKESALSAVTREALELRQHKDKTADVQLELSRTAEELRAARREAQQLPSVSAQLRGMRDQAEGESRRVAELQAEVEASKAELEAMVGRLKYGELEQRSVAKKLGRAATQEQQQMAAAQEEAALVAAQIVADANAALGGDAASGAHPVFGELLRDDGHKRLYSASPTTLWAGTSTWHKQRAFRAERAELIAKAKQRSSVAGWPGSICVVESGGGGGGGGAGGGADGGGCGSIGMVVDGQHRLGAAHVLSSKGKLRPDLARVLVEVYQPMGEREVRELFTEINKVEPVTLVDLPQDQGGAGEEEAAIITQAAESLRAQFPSMFKPSTSCRAPHLNVDALRNELHKAALLQRRDISSSAELVAWLLQTNESLAARPDEGWRGAGPRPRYSDAVLDKARREGFFLGLGLEWLHADGQVSDK